MSLIINPLTPNPTFFNAVVGFVNVLPGVGPSDPDQIQFIYNQSGGPNIFQGGGQGEYLPEPTLSDSFFLFSLLFSPQVLYLAITQPFRCQHQLHLYPFRKNRRLPAFLFPPPGTSAPGKRKK